MPSKQTKNYDNEYCQDAEKVYTYTGLEKLLTKLTKSLNTQKCTIFGLLEYKCRWVDIDSTLLEKIGKNQSDIKTTVYAGCTLPKRQLTIMREEGSSTKKQRTLIRTMDRLIQKKILTSARAIEWSVLYLRRKRHTLIPVWRLIEREISVLPSCL